MKKENIIIKKSYDFALRIIKLSTYLRTEKKEFILSRQILKSGTSIGANIEEAEGAQSRADFVSKLHISLKEAKETKYWLRLLRDSKIVPENLIASLINDCSEMVSILNSILITTKRNSAS